MKQQTRQQMETTLGEMRHLTLFLLSHAVVEYPTEAEKALHLIQKCLDSVKEESPEVYRLIQEQMCRDEIIKSIRNP